MEIVPKIAAQLAEEVYAVQQQIDVDLFMMNPIFSSAPGHTRTVQATLGTRLINTRDGFCVAARGSAGYEKDLFLMFRGSTTKNYGADWFSNARCGVQSSPGGLVHVGFSHIFKSMQKTIDDFVTAQLNDRANPIQTIHCVGHSLGGAVATMAADWAKRKTNKTVFLYTFGAPKPGFENFAKSLTKLLGANNIHRTYHATDPVPMVPLYPFTHSPMPGTGHLRGSSHSLLSAGAHDMGEYMASVKQLNWTDMKTPPPPPDYDRVVEKWLEAEGSLNPFNAETWKWIDAGLQYVLKKILGVAATLLQGAFTGALTLADKIAWILQKGIDLTIEEGKWVFLLMRKMMRVLGMKVANTVQELTRALMRVVLERIMEKITQEARKALLHLTRR